MVVGLAYTGVKLEKVDENEEQVQERGTGQGQKQTRDGGNVYISATKLVESPEYSASFLSRMYFTWLDEIIEKAGRVKLEYIDLFKFKGNDLPGACWERFKKTDASSTTNKSKKRSLLMRLAILLKWELILKVSVGLLLTVFKFSGPFFINQILNYLENKEGNEKQNGRAEIYGYCVGLLIFTTIQYIMENQSLWIGRKLSIKLKNALSCEIAEKSLNSLGSGGEEEAVKSNNAQQEGDTSGQENSTREALGLVSTDLTRVSEYSGYIDFCFISIIQALVAIIYLYKLLGPSSLFGIVVMASYYPLTKSTFNRVVDLEDRKNSALDKRISAVSEMIGGMRAVKLFGWEEKFVEKITKLRSTQLGYLWEINKIWITIGFGTLFIPILVLFSSFLIYSVILGHEMTNSIAFTSLGVFEILKVVFDMFFEDIKYLLSALVSLRRLESFIEDNSHDISKTGQSESDETESASTGDFGFVNATLSWEYSQPQNQGDCKHKSNENTPLLDVDNGDATKSNEFKLQNLNIKFLRGKLTIITGKVGSGKTSMLRALLGEMKLVEGYMMYPRGAATTEAATTRPGSVGGSMIGYVPQESWLRNATVRDNILFGSEYDVERYEQVLKMTALKADFRQLVNGDQSQVGERGITLSGGQKQRISLARALYSQAQCVLLDDVLSAVDSQTAHHIVYYCFDPSTRSKIMEGRTIVLVTHMVDLVAKYASWIVVMESGRVAEQGNGRNVFSYFSTSSTDDTQPILPQIMEKQTSDPSEDEFNQQKLLERQLKNSRLTSNRNSEGGDDDNDDESDAEDVEDAGEEQREYGTLRLDVWWAYFSSMGGSWFWVAVVSLALGSRIVQIFQNYLIRIWLQSEDNSSSASNSMYFLSMYLLVGILFVVLQQLANYSIYKGGIKSSKEIHYRLTQSVSNAIPSFFDVTPVGRIINRFSRDTMRLDERIIENITYFLSHVISAISVFVVVISVTPAFIIVSAAVTAIFLSRSVKYLNAIREIKRLDSNTLSPVLSIFVELGGNGSSVIRAFNKTHDYILETARRVDTNNRSYYLEWSLNRWISLTTDSIGSLVSFFASLMIIIAIDYFPNSGLDSGLAGFVLSYALGFNIYAMWTIRDYADLELGMNAMERISQYFEDRLPQQVQVLSTIPPQPNTTGETSLWPSSGELVVKNLSVKYDNTDKFALNNISFTLPPAKTLAVVGRTGSGKSTLTLALLRLVERVQKMDSHILIDGVDISSVPLTKLRQSITIIPQDPLLFSGSLRHNLDLFDEYPDEQLLAAVAETGLFDGVTIDSLDFTIHEKGANLSTGQKQLVSLTRALLRRSSSRIIILDEATASVDYRTEQQLIRAIKQLNVVHKCSIITIAHRLNTVYDYDYTLTLDNGTLASFVQNDSS